MTPPTHVYAPTAGHAFAKGALFVLELAAAFLAGYVVGRWPNLTFERAVKAALDAMAEQPPPAGPLHVGGDGGPRPSAVRADPPPALEAGQRWRMGGVECVVINPRDKLVSVRLVDDCDAWLQYPREVFTWTDAVYLGMEDSKDEGAQP